jgi:tRNA(fMet)-specific endonuclease VapC
VSLFILDTDHLSLYQRAAEPLLSKLLSHPPDELAITIITVEEQMRGRLAQIRRATTGAHLNECYRWLGETVTQLARLPVIHFDDKAATVLRDAAIAESPHRHTRPSNRRYRPQSKCSSIDA